MPKKKAKRKHRWRSLSEEENSKQPRLNNGTVTSRERARHSSINSSTGSEYESSNDDNIMDHRLTLQPLRPSPGPSNETGPRPTQSSHLNEHTRYLYLKSENANYKAKDINPFRMNEAISKAAGGRIKN